MSVKFVYSKGLKFDKNKEQLLDKVITNIREILLLPETIIIEFNNLQQNNYGETVLNTTVQNRIKLQYSLSYKESIFVLSHELVHLSQIQCGQLSYTKNGDYLWEGIKYCNCVELKTMPYEAYQQLPWELDVVKKQQKILDHLLKN